MDTVKPLVLLVEDREFQASLWKDWLELDGMRVIWANTIETAEAMFFQNSDIAGIIMDACVPGTTPNTQELVAKIRQADFTGPILAASTSDDYIEVLLNAGCNYGSYKDLAAKVMVDLLKGVENEDKSADDNPLN